jgi:hypothetical protein
VNALLLGLALAARAQDASTAAVSASTEAAVAVSSGGVRVSDGTKPRPKAVLHATVHPDARDWEPFSLRVGGDPGQAANGAFLRQVKSKGRLTGVASKARSAARLVRAKEDRWLVVSVFPKALEKRRLHVEVRLRVVEGYVEDVKVFAVCVVDPRPAAGAGLDSFALRAEGVEFSEESPASAEVLLSALDPRPGKGAFNAGRLKAAAFADRELGFAELSWSVRGLAGPR